MNKMPNQFRVILAFYFHVRSISPVRRACSHVGQPRD